MLMRLLLTLVVAALAGCASPNVRATGDPGSGLAHQPAHVALHDASAAAGRAPGAGASDDSAVDSGVGASDPAPSSPDTPPARDVIPGTCCSALAQDVCAAPDPRCTRLAQAAAACFDGLKRAQAKQLVLDTLRKALAPTPLPDTCR